MSVIQLEPDLRRPGARHRPVGHQGTPAARHLPDPRAHARRQPDLPAGRRAEVDRLPVARLPRAERLRRAATAVATAWASDSSSSATAWRCAGRDGLRETAAAAPERPVRRRAGKAAVHLAVLEDTDVVYLEKIVGPTTIQVPTRVGGRMNAACSGLGKAILGFSDREAIGAGAGPGPRAADAVLGRRPGPLPAAAAPGARRGRRLRPRGGHARDWCAPRRPSSSTAAPSARSPCPGTPSAFNPTAVAPLVAAHAPPGSRATSPPDPSAPRDSGPPITTIGGPLCVRGTQLSAMNDAHQAVELVGVLELGPVATAVEEHQPRVGDHRDQPQRVLEVHDPVVAAVDEQRLGA